MERLNTLIADHPAAVVLVFSALIVMVQAMLALLAYFGRREMHRIEEKEGEQDVRLGKIEDKTQQEEVDLAEINTTLREHVRKEESVWVEVREIRTRVRTIQTQMPNGDLKQMARKMDVLTVKIDGLTGKVDTVAGEVREHNCEAEKWKREIVEHRVRIAGLEKG